MGLALGITAGGAAGPQACNCAAGNGSGTVVPTVKVPPAVPAGGFSYLVLTDDCNRDGRRTLAGGDARPTNNSVLEFSPSVVTLNACSS